MEVISEGYGEEIVGPKRIIPLSKAEDKMMDGNESHEDVNELDEMHKDCHLHEEWKQEKIDLQQQVVPVNFFFLSSFNKFTKV